ncbi:AAA family ATPase [Vagococcus carniphilus]|uniref:AAA family ATPase n=1 Tax=Vagococcus carniphilus TaxID=218144 RepID=A0AAW8UBS1_9ENTE|nr:AAA family ATPase [Vagococcus carniphilus]MDT2835134.1 AAA family ATPase [Vagococcus carniphilus]
MNLFLKTFRLVGIENNYEFEFKKGLNFISGPTSTGKTTIFELIDYALGSKSHKAYIEVGQKCNAVELEIILAGTLYKIKRTLFQFNLPVLVEIFDHDSSTFVTYNTFNTDSTLNEKSLSTFLLSKLNLNNVKISNQSFSFRDLFRFSYLKQTVIDNEDILSEKNWPIFNKNKSTFEIIFNIYDELLGELKTNLVKENDELHEEIIRFQGIELFLKNSGIENFETVELKKKELTEKINQLNNLLKKKKEYVEGQTLNSSVRDLNNKVLEKKERKKSLLVERNNQEQYLKKLNTLQNQYQRDIEKIEATIMGVKEINQYDFIVCPNCLQPLSVHPNDSNCLVCGNTMDSLVENTLLLKKEKTTITKKKNQLEQHILQEVDKRNQIEISIKKVSEEISYDDSILESLTEQYINPFVEEISLINLKLGKSQEKLNELNDSLRFIKELNRLLLLLHNKEIEIANLKEQIEKQKSLNNDKKDVISSLSATFSEILSDFKFPKLENAYIDEKNYLPYVRGRKYNDLGSLGAVTLITMAYFLSILVESTSTLNNHLNLLMIDTPGKNLGLSSESEEFQDESIFNAIIKYFISLDEVYSEEIQLIVINNGYPDFLPKKNVILEFSNDGRSGLISDI